MFFSPCLFLHILSCLNLIREGETRSGNLRALVNCFSGEVCDSVIQRCQRKGNLLSGPFETKKIIVSSSSVTLIQPKEHQLLGLLM